jgi:hypothetical protein
LTNFLDNFIKQNEKVLNYLEQLDSELENSDQIIAEFKEFLSQTNYNPALGLGIISYLQLLNKKENYSDFELSDINRLLESLIKLQKYNLDIYVEAGYYEWAVLDNKDKALEILKTGLEKANQKTAEIQKIINEIEATN